jgi:putative protease
VKRIILARELHVSEIEEIKKAVPEIELEAFIHGAMCMTYSGRCLL